MRYRIIVSLVLATLLFSCKKDDDNNLIEVPPSLLGDVAPEDDATIREFLNTHFYNYEDFQNEPNVSHEIIIDTIAGANADKTPMSEFAESIVINVSSSFLGLEAEEIDIPHTLYFIDVKQGTGDKSPTVADSVLVRYQGSLLDGTLFDESKDFIWQELAFSAVRGFPNGIAQLKSGTADQIVDNPDGTYEITNSGQGIIIIPSGLAYFNRPPTSAIPLYANMLFKVEVGLFMEDTDNDNDGIPSIMEDLNGNGYLFDDNTDVNSEPTFSILANFRDADDDGDGVSTRKEITDDNGNIIFPYPDADGDGVPDYLDPDTN